MKVRRWKNLNNRLGTVTVVIAFIFRAKLISIFLIIYFIYSNLETISSSTSWSAARFKNSWG